MNLSLEYFLRFFIVLFVLINCRQHSVHSQTTKQMIPWEPVGLSGGGGMFSPAISPADPNLMMLNCDMSAAYISEDGGHNWRMINHAQLKSDMRCRPGFHPSDPNVIYASSSGRLRISRDRGITFSPIGNLKEPLYGEIAINPSNPEGILVGTRDGRSWLSHDGGATWTLCNGPKGLVFGFHFDRTCKGHTMFAATDKGIWRSDDDGGTWTDKSSGLLWKQIQGFTGSSNQADDIIILYCTVSSKDEDGVFKGGVYSSCDRGETCNRRWGVV